MAFSSTAAVMLAGFAITSADPVEAPRPAAGVLLRHSYEVGEELRYRIDSETTYLTIKGQTRETSENRTHTDQRLTVMSVDADGSAKLRLTIDRARMQYSFNGQAPSTYDSKNPRDAAPIFAAVGRGVGRPIAEIRFSPEGAAGAVAPLLDADELANIPGKCGLEGDGPSNLLPAFPKSPVEVGGEWSDLFNVKVTVTNKLSRDVKILRQYRLESVDRGVATISFRTAPLVPVEAPDQAVQLIQRTTKGSLRFDLQAGRLLERTISVDNTALGWQGEDSSMRAVSSWTERLVTGDQTASVD